MYQTVLGGENRKKTRKLKGGKDTTTLYVKGDVGTREKGG